eukprot:COSAG03_NODE_943_length_5248_cov_12.372111_5_plen_54_part_00
MDIILPRGRDGVAEFRLSAARGVRNRRAQGVAVPIREGGGGGGGGGMGKKELI